MSSITHLPLLTTTDDEQGLLCAASEGAFEQVQYYLEKGASLNARDIEDGSTPLHLACRNGANRIVTLLLSKGAELNARNSQGRTPLHGASREGRMAIVSLLLDKGAQVNAADNDGSTPLHLACSNGQETVATWLLESGADVDAKDSNGRTSLDMASENGHGKIVTLLLKKKSERKRGTQLQQRRHSKMALNRTNESGLNSRPSSDAINDAQQPVKGVRTPKMQPFAASTNGDEESISVMSETISMMSLGGSTKKDDNTVGGPSWQQMSTMRKTSFTTEDDMSVATRSIGISDKRHGNKRHARSQSLNSLDNRSYGSLSTASMLNKFLTEDELQAMINEIDNGEGEVQPFVTDKPNDLDVCFRKIAHPGNKKWHEVVKRFSIDKEKFPYWQDEFCGMIQNQLRQEHGIGRFLICRDDNGNPSNLLNGKWFMATKQEILVKTRQRFLDDRKPPSKKAACQVNNKRPRGRPSKKQKADSIIPNDGVGTMPEPLPAANLSASVALLLSQCRTAIEQHQTQPSTTPPAPGAPSVMTDEQRIQRDLEIIQHFVRGGIKSTSDHGNLLASNAGESFQVRGDYSDEAGAASPVPCASRSDQALGQTTNLLVYSSADFLPRDEIHNDDNEGIGATKFLETPQIAAIHSGEEGDRNVSNSVSANVPSEELLLLFDEPFDDTTSLCFNELPEDEQDNGESFVMLCRDSFRR